TKKKKVLQLCLGDLRIEDLPSPYGKIQTGRIDNPDDVGMGFDRIAEKLPKLGRRGENVDRFIATVSKAIDAAPPRLIGKKGSDSALRKDFLRFFGIEGNSTIVAAFQDTTAASFVFNIHKVAGRKPEVLTTNPETEKWEQVAIY